MISVWELGNFALGESLVGEIEADVPQESVANIARLYDSAAAALSPVYDPPMWGFETYRHADRKTALLIHSTLVDDVLPRSSRWPRFRAAVQTLAGAILGATGAERFSGEEVNRQRVRVGELRETAMYFRGLAKTRQRQVLPADLPKQKQEQARRAEQHRREEESYGFKCSDPLNWLTEPGRAWRECAPPVPGWAKVVAVLAVGYAGYRGARAVGVI